ncbi:LacI family DNA-binding transcriptional regulator [Agromyces atrinae]|uniref:DNA-binding LacI/PurR family transcriptional regulator n=1 Tax=Agromyces atrinae TaxID=592376 RepID=A0A4Q2M5D2_9MICO|nr:LacI family DNA-binding transcriptional regulator [Agromyces atrinae]NYD68480.1 DNA-binding LacI/PurR family transcriptional regulator [Agromyces atrinae]RXZ84972.1 LacI family transcriptional regulator [Agromyces atrinae]
MTTARQPRRVTIADVAREAQTSTASVSYALNDRPGVSPATRERVLAAAARLGWSPTSAARVLAGGGSGAIGLVVGRDPRELAIEPFYMQFIAGVESTLAEREMSLVLELAPNADAEVEAIRRWHRSRRVDGVLLTDVIPNDPRIAVAQECGIPAVVIGDPAAAAGLTALWTDDASAMEHAVEHLAALGHRRITRLTAPARFAYTAVRDAAFERAARARGMEPDIVRTDLSLESGAAGARAVLTSTRPPTALVFDNDVMAVAALTATHELGLSVPRDVSIVAWDDSLLCRLVTPPVTALGHDIVALGAHAARRMLAVIDGAEPAAHQEATPTLQIRASTGPPPAEA